MDYSVSLLVLLCLFNSGYLSEAKPKKGPAVAMHTSSVIKEIPLKTYDTGQSTQIVRSRMAVQKGWVNEDVCGVPAVSAQPRSQYQPRIINGTNSVKGQWPWQAMILRYYSSSGAFIFVCGGSLIQNQWVLSAAHCFGQEPPSYTHIALGGHFKNLSEPSVKTFAVSSIRCHNSYIGGANSFKDDICLAKLAGKVAYTQYIRPVCLPTIKDIIKDGQMCAITGWGVTNDPAKGDILQKADVSIIQKSLCSSWYRQSGIELPTNHLCAGHRKGYVDSCQGDSGGPLVCPKSTLGTTPYILQGITSFGQGCAVKERPGVYTTVSNYVDWVQGTVSANQGADECFSATSLHTCGSTITEHGTLIRSPVVDTETWIYPANSKCSWNIHAPLGYHIQLEFKCFFHVEIKASNTSECYDYMNITSSDINSIYCGTRLLVPVPIRSRTAILSFHSDSSVQSSGFLAKVNFVAQPPTNSTSSLPITGVRGTPNGRSSNSSYGGNNTTSLNAKNFHFLLCLSLLYLLRSIFTHL